MNGKAPVPPIVCISVQRENYYSCRRKCSCRKEKTLS